MVVDSNGNAAECTECDPPRRFKSKAGLNGHTQFKHGHLPDTRAPIGNGKQSQMYQDLTDRVNLVLDRQDDIFDYLKHENDNGLANWNGNGQGNGQGNGNGNGLAMANGNGNGNGFSDERIGVESPRPPEDEIPYTHKASGWFEGPCGAQLERLQTPCPRCDKEIDWSSLED